MEMKKKFEIDNKLYDVIITRKNNKNTYIRVKKDLKITVTTNYLTSQRAINDLIKNNQN